MGINTLKIDGVENLIFCGDVHGNFLSIPNKCAQYDIKNSLVVVCGDIGVGFGTNPEGSLHHAFRRLDKRLKKSGNRVVFVRGNHDNPIFFNDLEVQKRFDGYDSIKLVPDYTVLEVSGDGLPSGSVNVLCVGGGCSIDRKWRIEEEAKTGVQYYWEDELPVFDAEKVKEVNERYPNAVNIIATHTCPSFAYPNDLKSSPVQEWLRVDPEVYYRIKGEREVMDKIWEALKGGGQSSINHWCYGHFHQSNTEAIDGVKFQLLGIEEFYEFRGCWL